MSDVSGGPGWWIASDGKWYPPESAPPPPPPPPPPPGDVAQSSPVHGAVLSAPTPYGATAVPTYPPVPPAPAPKASKPFYKRVLFWVLVVIVVFMGGCIGIIAGVGNSIDHAAHVKHTIVYTVTGSGTSTATSITYATLQEGNGQNGEAQVSNASLPWSKTITASGLVTAFSLSVQNGSVGLSYVVCTITEDGKVLNTNKAEGPYAIASCSAAGK